MTRRTLIIAVSAALLLLGACTGGSDATEPTTVSTAPPTTPGPGTAASNTAASAPTTAIPTTVATRTSCAEPNARRWAPLGEPGTGGWGTAIAISPFDDRLILSGGDVFGIHRTTDGGASWLPASGLASLEVERITWNPTDPDEAWAATLSGPHVSHDGGATWELARTGFPELAAEQYSAPVSAIVFDPADDARLLAFSGTVRHSEASGGVVNFASAAYGAVWESVDGGVTWGQLGTVLGSSPITDAIVLGGNRFLAAVDEIGVFASSDGGRSWQQAGAGLPQGNVRDLDASGDGSLVVAGLGPQGTDSTTNVAGGVFRSFDGGASFSAVPGLGFTATSELLASGNVRAVRIAPNDPQVVFAADNAFGVQVLYRSTDGGDSWTTALSTFPDHFYTTTGLVHAIDVGSTGEHVVVSANEAILGSSDGGTSWTDLSATKIGDQAYTGTGISGLVTTDVGFVGDGRIVLTGLDAGNLIESTDDGASWSRPLRDEQRYTGSTSVAVRDHAGGTTTIVALGQLNQQRYIGFVGLARSTAPGSWEVLAEDRGLPPIGTLDVTARSVSPTADGFVAVIGGELYRSTDDGLSWQADGLSNLRAVASLPAAGAPIWAAGSDGVYVSRDGTTSWTTLDGSPPGVRHLAVDPSAPDTIYATSTDRSFAGLWRWREGDGWVALFVEPQQPAARQSYSAAVDPTTPGRIVVVTNDDPYHDQMRSTGVYCSLDGGSSWSAINEGLPMTRFQSATFDPERPGRIIIGSNGMGYFAADLGG